MIIDCYLILIKLIQQYKLSDHKGKHKDNGRKRETNSGANV